MKAEPMKTKTRPQDQFQLIPEAEMPFNLAGETLPEMTAAHQRIIDLENLLTLALPCVEESEEFNKPNRRTLSTQIREEIA